MLVMGGIIGSGIFINPYVVARQVHSPALVLGAWLAGGFIALAGAFIYAELASAKPAVGGQYAYIREAYHPALAFLYGWALLLVIQTGGMAAVAVTFARYFRELTGWHSRDWVIAVVALGVLTGINCLGVRAGSAVQSAFMIVKIVAIAVLIACGLLLVKGHPAAVGAPDIAGAQDLAHLAGPRMLTSIGAAMAPVLFAYGGWQTASFVAGEMRRPERDLPRGLLIGVCGVITLYLLVNVAYINALGVAGLAATTVPASSVMRLALGESGGTLIALGIAMSTFGFLSQSVLTAPRVYYAMAQDGLFFKSVSRLSDRTHAPVYAIALQGLLAAIIAISGGYEQILNYVVSVDFIFFGLTATCVFIFRRRAPGRASPEDGSANTIPGRRLYRVPGHPVTTLVFIISCWLVVVNTIYKYPRNTLIGVALVLAGIPVYFLWTWRRGHGAGDATPDQTRCA
jgi:APA family basic amino acid/polyamine antiporter